VNAYLALRNSVLAYHRGHGVPEPVSWATLADLGRRLSIDRQAELGGRLMTLHWLSLHVRGAIHELGRLQFQRGRSRLKGLAGNPW
jgi:N-acyltransferase N-terminal domain